MGYFNPRLPGGCQAPPSKDFPALNFFEGREAPRLGGHLTKLHCGTSAKKRMSVSIHIPEKLMSSLSKFWENEQISVFFQFFCISDPKMII